MVPAAGKTPALLLMLLALAACGGDDEVGSAPGGGGGGGGGGEGGGGTGGSAGALTDPCPLDEVPGADGCVRPGVPLDGCGVGFEHDGEGGCVVVLPAQDCAPGTMALPGETSCRELAPCGSAPWGDIPTTSTTEHVDGSYPGGDSDGSAAKPWTTIQAGVLAAAAGEIIAVAAGDYVEDVFVYGTAGRRIWGRCPSMVSLVGVPPQPEPPPQQPATIFVTDDAPGTVVRGLAISGPKKAVYTIALDTALEQVWIHDTAQQGIFAVDSYGPSASLSLRDSLLERTTRTAVFAAGSDLLIERTVIRDTHSDQGSLGRGVYIDRTTQDDATPETSHASLVLRRSLLLRNRAEALRVDGAEALVEDTAIIDTLGQSGDDDGGIGVGVVWHAETGARPLLSMVRSVVSRSHGDGMLLVGADVILDAVVVEDTQPLPSGRYGRGIELQGDVEPAGLEVRRSVVRRNHGAGALIGAADALFEDTLVLDTQSEPSGPFSGQFGYGLTSQPTADGAVMGILTVRRSLVRDNRVAGVATFGGTVELDRSRVAGHLPDALGFGDGLVVYALVSPADASVVGSLLHDNSRAGVAAFGATVTIADSLLFCNQVDMNGEITAQAVYGFLDEGGNACGCGELGACQVLSSALAPPAPP